MDKIHVSFLDLPSSDKKAIWSGELNESEVHMLLSCDAINLPAKGRNGSLKPYKIINKVFNMEHEDDKSITVFVAQNQEPFF